MIAESGDTILAPIDRHGREADILPGVAGLAIIFTHCAPLELAEIRFPFVPETILGLVSLLLFEPKMLSLGFKIDFVHGRMCSIRRHGRDLTSFGAEENGLSGAETGRHAGSALSVTEGREAEQADTCQIKSCRCRRRRWTDQ